MSKISDLIQYSLDSKPIEFSETFNEIMTNKISDVLDDLKIEVAKSIFDELPASNEEVE
jgi:hypothetical protein